MKKIPWVTALTVLGMAAIGCVPPESGPQAKEVAEPAETAAMTEPDGILTIPRGRATLDGDPEEWAGAEVQWHSLDKLYYGEPDARDISEGHFAARWDEESNKIYVAVLLKDNDDFRTNDFGPLGDGWDDGDRIEILSAGDGEAATGWSTKHTVAQEYVVGVTKSGGAWAAWGTGDALHEDTGLEYAVHMLGNEVIYEAAVRLFDNYGRFVDEPTVVTKLKAGNVVRFDIIINTRHKDGFGMLALDDNAGRYNDSGKITQWRLAQD